MAVIMVPFWIFIVFSIVGSNAAGQFNVLHSPGSLKFYGSAELQESNLKEVFSASLGLAVEENSDWNGLTVTDPFSTPEAIVEVYVDGVTSLSSAFGAKAAVYPLIVDEYEPDTFDSMKHRINQRCTNGACKLVNILLNNIAEVKSYPDVFGDIVPLKHSKQSLIHLKTSCEEDKLFLTELENLKAITNTIKSGAISPDNNVDFYNLRFTSLHAMSDFHGPNSLPLKEAKTLLGEALLDLKDALQKAYEGSVLVTVVCTDVVHTRRTISKRQAAPSQQTEPLTAATQTSNSYPADYAAIFNILLWFGVIFTFTLVAIVYAIMDMDPGRDSIIYRMTSTRMKKDN